MNSKFQRETQRILFRQQLDTESLLLLARLMKFKEQDCNKINYDNINNRSNSLM